MMANLEALYDEAFFAEWGSTNSAYVEGARMITQILMREFSPTRVLDLGCGCGVYGHWFQSHGVEVVSVDGVQPHIAYSYPVSIQTRDITVPFDNAWGRFDFCLCLEVAEHIPEYLSDVFLDNLTQFSDSVILSAAPPGQGGHHHVNEQPKRYWVKKLADRGFNYDRPATGRLMEAFKEDKPPMMWMTEHISLYRRAVTPMDQTRSLPFSARQGGRIRRSQPPQ